MWTERIVGWFVTDRLWSLAVNESYYLANAYWFVFEGSLKIACQAIFEAICQSIYDYVGMFFVKIFNFFFDRLG